MPRTGRPIKGSSRKDKSLQLRVSQDMLTKLQYCSDRLKTSRTEVLEQGVNLIYDELNKK